MGERQVICNFYAPLTMYEKLKEAAERRGISFSKLVRDICREYLEREAVDSPNPSLGDEAQRAGE